MPLTIRWIIEGEEEVGSPHAERLRADGCFWEGSGFGRNEVPTLGLGSKGLLYLLKEAFGVGRFNDGLAGFELRKRASFSPTGNIAGLASGYAGEGTKTVLPARAMAKIDFRLVPDQDPDDILAKLKSHLQSGGYGDIVVSTWANCGPEVTSLEEPLVQKIIGLVESCTDEKVEITPISGGTLPLLGALRRVVGLPGLSAPAIPPTRADAPMRPTSTSVLPICVPPPG